MKLAIVCCLHGNEKYGLEVVERLPSVPFIIGNKKATLENKRFTESDMNRIFPGKENGNYEEKEAFKLKNNLTKFNQIIDLHSTSNGCPLFGIITKPNKEKIQLAKKLGLKRLLIMSENFASGKALIDHHKLGISLEIGPHGDKEKTLDVITKIENLVNNKNQEQDLTIYKPIEIIKRSKGKILIENFKEVKKGQHITETLIAKYDFIPVLVGEKSYSDVLCVACKKLNKEYLYSTNE